MSLVFVLFHQAHDVHVCRRSSVTLHVAYMFASYVPGLCVILIRRMMSAGEGYWWQILSPGHAALSRSRYVCVLRPWSLCYSNQELMSAGEGYWWQILSPGHTALSRSRYVCVYVPGLCVIPIRRMMSAGEGLLMADSVTRARRFITVQIKWLMLFIALLHQSSKCTFRCVSNVHDENYIFFRSYFYNYFLSWGSSYAYTSCTFKRHRAHLTTLCMNN